MSLSRALALSAGLLVGAAQCDPPAAPDAGAPSVVATIPGRCVEYEPLLEQFAPPFGWDSVRMSQLMSRESGCTADIRSRTRDTGLLQINDINHSYLTRVLGEPVDRWTLTDPTQNVRAAAALCEFWVAAGRSCYRAWSA